MKGEDKELTYKGQECPLGNSLVRPCSEISLCSKWVKSVQMSGPSLTEGSDILLNAAHIFQLMRQALSDNMSK